MGRKSDIVGHNPTKDPDWTDWSKHDTEDYSREELDFTLHEGNMESTGGHMAVLEAERDKWRGIAQEHEAANIDLRERVEELERICDGLRESRDALKPKIPLKCEGCEYTDVDDGEFRCRAIRCVLLTEADYD